MIMNIFGMNIVRIMRLLKRQQQHQMVRELWLLDIMVLTDR